MVLAATVANLWERLLGLAPSSIDIEVPSSLRWKTPPPTIALACFSVP